MINELIQLTGMGGQMPFSAYTYLVSRSSLNPM